MSAFDTGKAKVKKICEVLQKETINPAKKQADEIISKAKQDSENIIRSAKLDANLLIEEAKEKINEERNIFQASINLASKKALDSLKQEIEENLFNTQLDLFVGEAMNNPQTVASLISTIIKAVEQEGINADFNAIISSNVDKNSVNKELVGGVIDLIKSKSVEVGDISGGAQVKVIDKNLTIDITDSTLKELLSKFVREDFRSVIFSS